LIAGPVMWLWVMQKALQHRMP